MTSLYEVLKRSKTAPQLAPDMFTALWAKSVTTGKIIELPGQVPLSFKANGKPLLDYLISGNMEQSGTPTQDNPIMPQECGERTGNLFDKNDVLLGYRIDANGEPFSEPGCAVSGYIEVTPNTIVNQNHNFEFSNCMAEYDENKTFIIRYVSGTGKITTSASTKYIRVAVGITRLDKAMVTMGATASSSYEPYGYKIPILSASTTTPVYLGEAETTRKIKKLVLDGTEEWQNYGPVPNTYRLSISNIQSIGNSAMCSHFVNSPISEIASGKFTVGSTWIYIRYADVADLADFKSYLAAQYAAGTPVTVWYVLAEPTTGIVNEPIRKIGDYADTLSMEQAGVQIPTDNGSTTLDVLTAVKPSNVSIKYRV